MYHLYTPRNTALPLHTKYKVNELISYKNLNITESKLSNTFDIKFLKSILPSIGTNNKKDLQQLAINNIYKALKPDGKLLFAENLTGSILHGFARKNFVKWGAGVRYITINEMEEFLLNFKTVEYKTYGFFGAFGRTEKQRNFLGKIDNLINLIIPRRCNYLIVGVATK